MPTATAAPTTPTADRPAGADPAAEVETFADVARRLGNVPPHRILWLPRPASEADQLRLVGGDPKRLVELVDGVLVEKAMGFRESLLAATLIGYLTAFVRPRNLGLVGGADGIMRLRPGRNRLPDVHFTTWARLPSDRAHLEPVADFAPDLAVEIVSEGNTPAEMARKRHEYFAAGARVVWVVDPAARTVEVYADPQRPDAAAVLREADTLTGDPALPGFALPLADLFNDPQLNPRP